MIARRASLAAGSAVPGVLLAATALLAATLAAPPARAATLLPLGAAKNYAIIYADSGGHNLSIANDTVSGSIGVGGTGKVQYSGPGVITGALDFSAPNTGQYSNSNPSNVGPSSVVYSDATVTAAITGLQTLSGDVSGGANLVFTNAGETVNEATGHLETVDGVVSRVFNVTAYSANDGSVLTIDGDGSGDPVVFNFGVGSGQFGEHNVNLGGTVDLAGTGLTSPDQVLFNFQSSGQNISLTNNGGTFVGILLAMQDTLSANHTNLDGRFFGGGGGDMHFVSGANIFVPIGTPEPATWAMMLAGFAAVGAAMRASRRRQGSATT